MKIDLLYALEKMPLILSYVDVTLLIAVCSMALTLVFSLAITIIRYYNVRILTPIVNVYIDLFRGTPLLTQLFFIYYGLAQLSTTLRDMTPITAAIFILALNASAYTTENMRSALESVPRGQTEAGLACGMTDLQVMWHIILPQATKVAVPVLANDFIALLKIRPWLSHLEPERSWGKPRLLETQDSVSLRHTWMCLSYTSVFPKL